MHDVNILQRQVHHFVFLSLSRSARQQVVDHSANSVESNSQSCVCGVSRHTVILVRLSSTMRLWCETILSVYIECGAKAATAASTCWTTPLDAVNSCLRRTESEHPVSVSAGRRGTQDRRSHCSQAPSANSPSFPGKTLLQISKPLSTKLLRVSASNSVFILTMTSFCSCCNLSAICCR